MDRGVAELPALPLPFPRPPPRPPPRPLARPLARALPIPPLLKPLWLTPRVPLSPPPPLASCAFSVEALSIAFCSPGIIAVAIAVAIALLIPAGRPGGRPPCPTPPETALPDSPPALLGSSPVIAPLTPSIPMLPIEPARPGCARRRTAAGQAARHRAQDGLAAGRGMQAAVADRHGDGQAVAVATLAA